MSATAKHRYKTILANGFRKWMILAACNALCSCCDATTVYSRESSLSAFIEKADSTSFGNSSKKIFEYRDNIPTLSPSPSLRGRDEIEGNQGDTILNLRLGNVEVGNHKIDSLFPLLRVSYYDSSGWYSLVSGGFEITQNDSAVIEGKFEGVLVPTKAEGLPNENLRISNGRFLIRSVESSVGRGCL